jgi:hypothetical protein
MPQWKNWVVGGQNLSLHSQNFLPSSALQKMFADPCSSQRGTSVNTLTLAEVFLKGTVSSLGEILCKVFGESPQGPWYLKEPSRKGRHTFCRRKWELCWLWPLKKRRYGGGSKGGIGERGAGRCSGGRFVTCQGEGDLTPDCRLFAL